MILDEQAFANSLGQIMTARVERVAKAMCRDRNSHEDGADDEPCTCSDIGGGSCLAFGLYGASALAAIRELDKEARG